MVSSGHADKYTYFRTLLKYLFVKLTFSGRNNDDQMPALLNK